MPSLPILMSHTAAICSTALKLSPSLTFFLPRITSLFARTCLSWKSQFEVPLVSTLPTSIETRPSRLENKCSPLWAKFNLPRFLGNFMEDISPRLHETDFKIQRSIGTGGFAIVHLATFNSPQKIDDSDKLVALKEIPYAVMSLNHLRHVQREVLTHARVSDYSHVATLYGSFSTFNRVYMALELLHGGDLYEAVKQEGFRIPEPVALDLTLQVARTLHHLHSIGVAHMDVKLENLGLVTRFRAEVGVNVVKIFDFGLARLFDPLNDRTRFSYGSVGTTQYMSPQAMAYTTKYDMTKADVYSLGVVLYKLLSASEPFPSGKNHGVERYREILRRKREPIVFSSSVWNNIRTTTKILVRGMLSLEEQDRPTALEALILLEILLSGESASASSKTKNQFSLKLIERRKEMRKSVTIEEVL